MGHDAIATMPPVFTSITTAAPALAFRYRPWPAAASTWLRGVHDAVLEVRSTSCWIFELIVRIRLSPGRGGLRAQRTDHVALGVHDVGLLALVAAQVLLVLQLQPRLAHQVARTVALVLGLLDLLRVDLAQPAQDVRRHRAACG